jgi:hypothetical protein
VLISAVVFVSCLWRYTSAARIEQSDAIFTMNQVNCGNKIPILSAQVELDRLCKDLGRKAATWVPILGFSNMLDDLMNWIFNTASSLMSIAIALVVVALGVMFLSVFVAWFLRQFSGVLEFITGGTVRLHPKHD